MAKGKKPDPSKKKIQQTHASYLKVAPGKKEPGYKAGEMYGCYGHRTHANQPCVFDITDGALQCPYCGAGLVAEWRGYVPVWDRDWALRYVLVNEEYFFSVDAITIGAQVVMSRAVNPISPLVIREENGLTRKLPDHEPYSKPIDMLAICLLLWKNEPLNRWFNGQAAKGEVEQLAMQKAVKKTTETKPPEDPAVRLMRHEAEIRAQEALEEQKIGNTINRVFTPNTNGKHPFSKPK